MLAGYLRELLFTFMLGAISVQLHAVDNPGPSGIFEQGACIECHEKDNPQLIKDWRNSIHASEQPVADCVACHGKLHQHTASTARHDSACITCHGGEKSPVVHSYITSKHGVLVRLEKDTYDWEQPLVMANYRSPGCSYCHMHNAGHNVNSAREKVSAVCQDCHAPRYITSLSTNGERMLEIARKKVREAETTVTQAATVFSDNELAPARIILETMQQHLKNVYLGIGHQSPDYQWWHGHPALDGDLLRIKGHIGDLYRK